MIRTLLQRGAKVNLTDEKGLTALDWALKQGETEVAALLREAGGKAMARSKGPVRVREPRTVPAAVDKVMPLLARAGEVSASKVTCVNCHNNSLTAVALHMARKRGFHVSDEATGHYSQEYAKTNPRVWEAAFWNGNNTSYVEWALAEAGHPLGIQTDAIVRRALRLQQNDGRWGNDGDSLRPPLSSSAIKTTAFNIRVLDVWAFNTMRSEARTAIVRARDYLKAASARDTQDTVFQLLGLRWAGADASDIARIAKQLLALQREDGGWGQMSTMPTDAYATGQALYGLHIGAGTPTSDGAYQRGVRLLLRDQAEDGSWFVPTRAFGFQPYYEGGFPHGVDQYISASASSWSAIALTFANNPVTLKASVEDIGR